ncbi:MAG: DNA-processing protein DprA [Oscillibacter sp.]|uniref:DNA-processing protein DprA n=1 Tax=uncultured Dysosmobacter sp. TaxID=2591384 RepID=UPI0025DC4383|nr:DNA-processing protein DprA [uncultured Dysosmobacter sp.]MDD6408222.1 DNA-processing protein DprA [Oscillibacter sp.]
MLKYWVWLSELKGLRNQTRLALLRRFGDPESIFYADADELLLTDGVERSQLKLLENHDLAPADRILADCQRLDIRLLTLSDAAYPGRLKNIYDPPALLYCKGRLPLLDDLLCVAVVGTRDCTPYGVACAEKLGFGLASGGAAVVSGLAKGIDAAAIRGALRAGGVTVGVVGNGLDVYYPYESRYLYEDVASAGILLSEYPPGTEPASGHFPVRNRIISGLSLAALVVEAPEKSGALITAATALEQGRDVFAVPGPIDAPASVGCNCLIRDGAGLVSDASDILREYEGRFVLNLKESREQPETLGYQARMAPEPKPVAPTLSLRHSDAELTDDQIAVLKALSDTEPMQVDDLTELVEIPTRRVLSALTVLEIDQYVAQHPGKRYTRTVTVIE